MVEDYESNFIAILIKVCIPAISADSDMRDIGEDSEYIWRLLGNG